MSAGLPIVQLAHSSFVWAAEVPRLEGQQAPGVAALALVRGFAADAPDGAALQLRYEAPEGGGRGVPLLVARARTEADAIELARLVMLTFPATHALRALPEAAVRTRLVPFPLDDLSPRHVAEIRRVAELDDSGRAVLLPWPVEPSEVDVALVLDRAPAGTLLCLQLEHAEVDEALVAQLHATVQDLRDDLDKVSDPTRLRALAAHRVWVRELPHRAVHLRATLIGAEPLAPGLADLVGLALAGTAPGESGVTYEVVRPRSRQELDLALQLVDDVRAGQWGGTDDVELEALRPVFSTMEAAVAFQLPAVGEGAGEAGRTTSVTFAAGRDRLMRAATAPGSDGFLVIDVARGDYAGLAAALTAETGRTVRRLRLDPTAPGFDPFVVPAGGSRHAHAGRVLAAFDLAYQASERTPVSWLLLSRAVYDAYDATCPHHPSIGHLMDAADGVLRRLELDGVSGSDRRAEVLGRLELLAAGPLGTVLEPGMAVDWRALSGTPTVIELGGLAGPQERLLVAGLLLAGFLSWREATPLPPGASHVVVIGGATRLTEAFGSDRPSTDGVAALVDAVGALGGSGQSVLVAHPGGPNAPEVLPAPTGWTLPTLACDSFAALPSVPHASLATPGVGS